MRRVVISFVVVALLYSPARCLDNGLALAPALGFNTWNAFGGDIDEDLIKETADLLVSTGLKKAGYQYLVIDDAWSNMLRTSDGYLHANTDRFPSGIKHLAAYVHSKGLKFGIYSDAGSRTCMGFPGSRGHEVEDAQSFASWDVDFLKYDNCWAPPSDWVVDRYTAMRDALNATGRPILYSMCDWGVGDPWLWADEVANSWRTTGDIAPYWESMLRCLDNTVGLSKYAKPGAWNDPDMLEVYPFPEDPTGCSLLTPLVQAFRNDCVVLAGEQVGNIGLSEQEQRANFALWAVMKSPLMVGTDLRSLSQTALDILTATEVLAINQDPLGAAGDLIFKEGPIEVYAGPLEDGARAAVLFNRHVDGSQYPLSNVTVRWEDIGLEEGEQARVRDLFEQKDLGTFSGSYTSSVYVHDAHALRITPVGMPTLQHREWRPWQQHGAMHAEVRSQRAREVASPGAVRRAKLARHAAPEVQQF